MIDYLLLKRRQKPSADGVKLEGCLQFLVWLEYTNANMINGDVLIQIPAPRVSWTGKFVYSWLMSWS